MYICVYNSKPFKSLAFREPRDSSVYQKGVKMDVFILSNGISWHVSGIYILPLCISINLYEKGALANLHSQL